MDKIDIHTPIIVGGIFNYFFLKYNKFSKPTAFLIALLVNSFFVFDVINSLFSIWADFYIVKNILVLCAALGGTYISVKGYKNNTLSGAHKVFAYMSFYLFILFVISIFVFLLIMGYMGMMI